jgi:surfeit locus 1 family protein
MPAADGATVDLERIAPRGAVADTALVLPFPGRETAFLDRNATATPADSPAGFRQVWFAMDEHALRRQFPYVLGEVQLQLLPTPRADEFPVRLEAPPLDPGPHLGYAIQWFSFALIALVGWMVMVMKTGVARGGNPSQ